MCPCWQTTPLDVAHVTKLEASFYDKRSPFWRSAYSITEKFHLEQFHLCI